MSSGGGGGGPHKKARIEIIPLIDIMFFLLASFMLVSMSMIKLRPFRMTCLMLTRGKTSSSRISIPSASTSMATTTSTRTRLRFRWSKFR